MSTHIKDSDVTRTGTSDDEALAGRARPCPQLFLVLSCQVPGAAMVRVSLSDVVELKMGRGSNGLEWDTRGGARQGRWQLRDDLVSSNHLTIQRCIDGWLLTDNGSKNGTFVNGRAAHERRLADGDVIQVGSSLFLFKVSKVPGHIPLSDRQIYAADSTAFDTLSFALGEQFDAATRIAGVDLPVLIRGETGTGKELVARELHERSGRKGAFVAVNCGAIPIGLVESELFGHVRGAFSGATSDKEGLIARANGGTLFLDEIAELPETSQVALLRVLQEKSVRPVGATDSVPLDVRFIAATHQNLEAAITTQSFREDLYARIRGFTIDLPPLRERREDIGLLTSRILGSAGPTLQVSAGTALLRHGYPLNIRELEHGLRAAAALSDDGELKLRSLPFADSAKKKKLEATKDELLRRDLIQVLSQTGGNVSATAEHFAKAPAQIRRWLKRLKINVDDFRGKS